MKQISRKPSRSEHTTGLLLSQTETCFKHVSDILHPSTPHTQLSDWDYLLPSSAESRPKTSVSFLVPPSAPSPPCCLLPSTHPGAMPSLQGAHGAMLQTFPIHPPPLPTLFFCLSWQRQHAGCSITLQSHLHQQGRCARDAPQGEPADQCSSFAHHCPGLT